MSAVSLTDAKEFLPFVTDDSQDDEVQDMLDRAEAILAKRVGPLQPVVVTDEVHTGPGPIVLKRFPVASFTSATSSDVAVSDTDADLDAGVVYGTFGSIRRAVKVSYVAGRASLPADLQLAVLELTQHLMQSQKVPGTSRGFQGFGGGSGDTDAPSGAGYLLPYRVQSLIEPYLLPTVA